MDLETIAQYNGRTFFTNCDIDNGKWHWIKLSGEDEDHTPEENYAEKVMWHVPPVGY